MSLADLDTFGQRSRIRTDSAEAGRVLIVDDDPDMCELLEATLQRRDFETISCGSAEAALSTLREQDFDVVVADLQLGGMNGLQLCERLAGGCPGLPVVVMTAWGNLDTAVGALRAGAFDFITKPFDIESLAGMVERALRHRRAQIPRLLTTGGARPTFDDIIGESASMRRLCELLRQVAATDASVLITGESGTGKELVARALHRQGPRRRGPFVAINCAAMPEALLESQLFGHVKGAFTDARMSRVGLLGQADGGTLFLDEIGDMPAALQPKLLRALQERCVRPVGGDTEISFDVRLIVATNRDLQAEASAGRFRMDLYFRINVIMVELPPLRERGNDILLLAQDAIERFAQQMGKAVKGLSTPAGEKLLAYHWPGNVRELHNCVERAVALTRHEKLVVDDLPLHVRHYSSWQLVPPLGEEAKLLPVCEVERRHILGVLEAVGGNKTVAARVLGLDRKTLYRKLKQYSQHPDAE